MPQHFGAALMQFSPPFSAARWRHRERGRFALLVALALVMGTLCGLSNDAHAQTAPAGSTITNVASATYTDGSGVARNAQSNSVTTTVQQVAALTLTQNNTAQGVPNERQFFPHTVTNTGNGPDTFNLTAANQANDNFDLTNLQIFADANGDGVPDNNTPITVTPQLATGATFSFVVAGTVPAAAVGQTANVLVTATSTFNNAIAASNTDTLTITNNADLQVNKSISSVTGTPGSGPYTVTIAYANNGARPASAVVFRDTLNAGFTYVPGSGRSTLTGATALTDATGDNQGGVDYSVTGTTVRVGIANIPAAGTAGSSGNITFQVNVTAGTVPGTIPNTISYDFNDGSTTLTNRNSNTVSFTVQQTQALSYTGQTLGPVAQGATVTFTNPLVNNSNGTDTFDIVQVSNNFPAGTTFRLLGPNGAVLTDTDGNGVVDTGPVAAGATFNVRVEAVLPIGASGGGPYNVVTSATSRFGGANGPTANATDTLTTITPSTVDVQNATGQGVGPGPETNPVRVDPGARGTTVRIPLNISNTSGVADAYNLQVSSTTGFTPPADLPAGYVVTFRDANGNPVTSTGSIPAGGTVPFFADVTIPANATPVNLDLYFRAVSPTTGAADIIHDQIAVAAARNLTLVANNTGQIFEGGSVVYTQTLTNNGNVTEATGPIASANSQNGFTSVIIFDANNNGVLDDSDPQVTDLAQLTVGTGAGLDPGEAARLFVRVTAPTGAAAGAQNVTTVTVTAQGGNGTAPTASITDTTTVVAGRLVMVKEQALDANDDGTPEGAYAQTNITTGAIPGAGIRYRITVTNTGAAPALNVQVTDPTPAFTVFSTGDGNPGAGGIPDGAVYTLDGTTFTPATAAPTNGNTGQVVWNIGTLAPGQTVTIYFGVRIRR